LDGDISDQLKQQIAAEMNISETAFLTRVESSASGDFTSGHHFGLRWFTPTTEVTACGLNFSIYNRKYLVAPFIKHAIELNSRSKEKG
jgi:hypothetical protein